MEDFVSPIPCRQDSSLHDLLWVPKGRRAPNQRRSSNETTRGRGLSTLGYGLPRTVNRPWSCQQPHTLETAEEECKTVTALIFITHFCLIITFPYSPGSGGTVLEVLAYCGPPLPGKVMGFPGGSAGKESACNVGDLDLVPGMGRFPGEGNGYPLQYSGLDKATLSFSSITLALYFCLVLVHREPRFWQQIWGLVWDLIMGWWCCRATWLGRVLGDCFHTSLLPLGEWKPGGSPRSEHRGPPAAGLCPDHTLSSTCTAEPKLAVRRRERSS